MDDGNALTPREALERKKARVLEEAEAIDREIAAIERLEREAAKYGLVLTAANLTTAQPIIPKVEMVLSQNNERQTIDRSVAAVIASYRSNKASPYQALRHATRQSYDSKLRIIDADLGDRAIGELKASDLLLVHQAWTKRGVTMAHGLVGMLRALANYGATTLKDRECDQLSLVLHRMRFKGSKSGNSEQLNEEQVKAIISKAHLAGLHSLALAQAFQFDCMLRQRDVIGEWVPKSEPGDSDVRSDGLKWLRGLRWEEIDRNLILRHITSKRLKEIEIDLRKAPMVMAEFARLGPQEKNGPVIVSEATGFPYKAHDFRAIWREVARAAGVPDTIKNMDSRGPISKPANTSGGLRGNGHAVHEELQEYRNPNLIPPGSLSR
jgi:hypothetical protein